MNSRKWKLLGHRRFRAIFPFDSNSTNYIFLSRSSNQCTHTLSSLLHFDSKIFEWFSTQNLLVLLRSTSSKFNFIPLNLRTIQKTEFEIKNENKKTRTQFAANKITRKMYVQILWFSYCMTDNALFTLSLTVCANIFFLDFVSTHTLSKFPLAAKAIRHTHRSSSFDSCT